MDLTVTFIQVIATLLLLCTGITSRKNEECISGIKQCYTAFVNDINKQTRGTEICRSVGEFLHCMLDMDCDLTRVQKNLAFTTVEKQLANKGLNCEEISKIKASHVREEENESSRTNKKTSSSSSYSNHPSNKGDQTAPKFPKEFFSETPEFFKTTPKSFDNKSWSAASGGGSRLLPETDVVDHILEPTSSRRSRRLPRPASWTSWGPQSQSSSGDGNNGTQTSALLSFWLFCTSSFLSFVLIINLSVNI